MKKTLSHLCLAFLVIMLLAQCKKTTCHNCTGTCATAHITDPGGGQSTETDCGSTAQVDTWEAQMQTAFAQQATYGFNYTVYFTSSGGGSHSFCGTSTQANDSVAYYTALGYTCQ
jgi:hypothetical protein